MFLGSRFRGGAMVLNVAASLMNTPFWIRIWRMDTINVEGYIEKK
jgi:hypothetical protein